MKIENHLTVTSVLQTIATALEAEGITHRICTKTEADQTVYVGVVMNHNHVEDEEGNLYAPCTLEFHARTSTMRSDRTPEQHYEMLNKAADFLNKFLGIQGMYEGKTFYHLIVTKEQRDKEAAENQWKSAVQACVYEIPVIKAGMKTAKTVKSAPLWDLLPEDGSTVVCNVWNVPFTFARDPNIFLHVTINRKRSLAACSPFPKEKSGFTRTQPVGPEPAPLKEGRFIEGSSSTKRVR